MKQEFEVSVEELLRTLKRRGTPLPSEMGAFITLEVCEQIIDRPALMSTQEVAINEIGEVLCATALQRCDEAEAVRALLSLLGDLLVCAAPGVPSMLLELVERGPSEGLFTLDRLRDDLEACLLPLNRGATRRVLARLLREARKAGPSAQPSARPSQPSAAEIDADFDALLGTPARGSKSGQGTSRSSKRAESAPVVTTPRGIFGSGASTPAGDSPKTPVRRRRDETPATVPMRGAFSSSAPQPLAAASDTREPSLVGLADQLEPDQHAEEPGEREPTDFKRPRLTLQETIPEPARHAPETRRRAGSTRPGLDTDGLVEARETPSRAGLWVFGACLVATLGLLGAYAGLGKDGVRSALGLLPQPRTAGSTSHSPFVGSASKAKTVGELRVTSNLGRAQVLLLIGPGPALATDLPVGVAQEFVALAAGYAPARAVVPAEAVWEEVDGKPQYELAIQATRSSQDAFKVGLGATLLPRDVGTPQAKLGSVRVVTTPKGAKVYQLIGFTPDVRVENLPLDEDYDVLVYLEGRAPVARHVEAADFEDTEGKRVCELDVTLAPAKGR